MRRKEDREISKITLHLFEGDAEQIREWYPRLGASKVIREWVHANIAKERALREVEAENLLKEVGQ